MSRLSPRGPGLIAFEVIFTVLITVVVALRVWNARLQRRPFAVSDWLIFVAYAAGIGFNALMFWGAAYGLGYPTNELTPVELAVMAKLTFGAAWTWTTGTVFCKLSILAFYMQIFNPKRTFRIACYVLMAICAAYEVAFIPVFVTACNPPEAAWEPWKGTCRPITSSEFTSVSVNLALDLSVIVLPMPYVWSLQMKNTKKVGVSIVFSMGFAIVAVLCWRLYTTAKLASGAIDPEYTLYTTAIQSTLEVSLGVLAACIPTLASMGSKTVIPQIKNFFVSLDGSYLRNKLSPSWSRRKLQAGSSEGDASEIAAYDGGHNLKTRAFSQSFPASAANEGMSSDYIGVWREVEVVPDHSDVERR